MSNKFNGPERRADPENLWGIEVHANRAKRRLQQPNIHESEKLHFREGEVMDEKIQSYLKHGSGCDYLLFRDMIRPQFELTLNVLKSNGLYDPLNIDDKKISDRHTILRDIGVVIGQGNKEGLKMLWNVMKKPTLILKPLRDKNTIFDIESLKVLGKEGNILEWDIAIIDGHYEIEDSTTSFEEQLNLWGCGNSSNIRLPTSDEYILLQMISIFEGRPIDQNKSSMLSNGTFANWSGFVNLFQHNNQGLGKYCFRPVIEIHHPSSIIKKGMQFHLMKFPRNYFSLTRPSNNSALVAWGGIPYESLFEDQEKALKKASNQNLTKNEVKTQVTNTSISDPESQKSELLVKKIIFQNQAITELPDHEIELISLNPSEYELLSQDQQKDLHKTLDTIKPIVNHIKKGQLSKAGRKLIDAIEDGVFDHDINTAPSSAADVLDREKASIAFLGLGQVMNGYRKLADKCIKTHDFSHDENELKTAKVQSEKTLREVNDLKRRMEDANNTIEKLVDRIQKHDVLFGALESIFKDAADSIDDLEKRMQKNKDTLSTEIDLKVTVPFLSVLGISVGPSIDLNSLFSRIGFSKKKPDVKSATANVRKKVHEVFDTNNDEKR